MLRIIKGGVILLMLLSIKPISAQNYYNSPYTRYLLGDLINSGFSYNRSVGGSSVGLRPKNQINYLNPASYTSQDTNSFLFQVGFAGRSAKVVTGQDSDNSTNFNIEYLAIGLPISKWWNLSIGTVPMSRMQYNFREVLDENIYGEQVFLDYSGFGGFNEFYIGNAVSVNDLVSVGVNFSYIFGSLDRTQESYMPLRSFSSASIENSSKYIASDFYFKTGIQIHPTIKEKHKLILGLTYDLATDLKITQKKQNLRISPSFKQVSNGIDQTLTDTLLNIDESTNISIPAKIGLGFGYTYNERVSINAEFITQDWSGTNIVASNFKSGVYSSIRFGASYNPEPISNKMRVNYLKRMSYRIGGNLTNSYLYATNGNINIKDIGMSAGLSFPIKNARKLYTGTTFNVAYQYGSRGTSDNGLIKENYQILTFGITLHDFWFLKPKYN